MADPVIETKAAFARRVGLSRARVTQYAAKGLPVTPDGKVDVGAALEWMSRELDPTQRVAQSKAKARPALVPPVPVPVEGDNDSEGEDDGNLIAARTEHEWLKVERARLALELARGDVAPWAEINRVLFEHGRRNRDAWMAWAQRVVPNMAAELKVDGGTLTAVLRKFVTAHLRELSEAAHVER
ncbi:hypothetical protein ABNQ39_11325 [Azospirillum sp. A26]|uniref:hypothetical protein n=1 Tax=Azospirillum sp. A26 TaxID=3160607 RepID=UPI00366FE473